MKINEVEALVGITKKNIRFYEAEGLLAPRRNSENGYRDYGEAEVEALRRIKLLRKLGVPLEEIRQMQTGVHTVGDGMRRHLVTLERERKNLEDAARVCEELADSQE
ncbi:MerR family transcriptional regulator, partial [Dysosmobacter sp.]|uniref:MerR family transcriptional regulator n=1 Tax=Dysosmobacter sp. TaxID=2591382 RepID=UPI002A8FAD78